IRVNAVPTTIVGVLPAAFTGVQETVTDAPDIALPLSLDPQLRPGTTRLTAPTTWWVQIVGRVKPGITAAQVEANFANVFQDTARTSLETYRAGLSDEARSAAAMRSRTEVPRLLVDSGSRGVYDVDQSTIRFTTMLSVVVALVLLIVC